MAKIDWVRRSGIVCVLAGMLAVGRAHADDAPAPTPREQADALIGEGVGLRKEGREAEALEKFRAANEAFPTPRGLGQMGLAAKSLRLYVEAEQYLAAALADTADPWVAQNREALEQARALVASQLASLVVRTNVAGAEVWVNGTRVATLPREEPIRVLAGSVFVEVRAAKHRASSQEAKLPAGSSRELVIELQPERDAETTVEPPKPPSPPAQQGAATEDAPLRPWIWTTLAFGSASVTAGAILGGLAISTKSDRDDVCPNEQCPTKRGVDLDEDLRTYAIATTVTVAVGATSLAASLALYLAEEPWKPASGKPATGRAFIVPAVWPNGGGAGLAGAF